MSHAGGDAAGERVGDSAPADGRVGGPASPAGRLADVPPGGLALFDLDGVLTRRDTFAGFVLARLRRRPLRLALALPLVPFMALPPTRRPAVTLAVQLSLARLTVAGFRAEAVAFADGLAATPRAIQRGCVEEARRQLDAGARVVFVTACEQTIARELLDRVGLPDVELVASRLERRGRHWHVALHNLGAEKPRQLAERGIVAPWDAAYSDHAVDLPLLSGARVAVLVNPGEAFERLAARELDGAVRTARWPAG